MARAYGKKKRAMRRAWVVGSVLAVQVAAAPRAHAAPEPRSRLRCPSRSRRAAERLRDGPRPAAEPRRRRSSDPVHAPLRSGTRPTPARQHGPLREGHGPSGAPQSSSNDALRDGAALFSPDQLAQLRQLLNASVAAAGTARVRDRRRTRGRHRRRRSPHRHFAARHRPSRRSRHASRPRLQGGYRDWIRDVAISEAKIMVVEVSLEPDVLGGAVRVLTAAGNEVAVDGRFTSAGSGEAHVQPGSHARRE